MNNTVEGILIVYGQPGSGFEIVTKEAAITAASKAKEQGKIIDYRIEETSATTGKIVATMRRDQDAEVVAAVTDFVYYRHRDLSPSNVIGFSPDEIDRIKLDDGGLFVFTVEDVHITETAGESDLPVWYVAATLQFQTDDNPIEGSTDIYQCYQCGDDWCIEWHSS